jgi:hypothetical protein
MYRTKHTWTEWTEWTEWREWRKWLLSWWRWNPFALTYQQFMAHLRNSTIPVVDRKHYFFTNGMPYMEYFEKHEYKNDLSYVASLINQPEHVVQPVFSQHPV